VTRYDLRDSYRTGLLRYAAAAVALGLFIMVPIGVSVGRARPRHLDGADLILGLSWLGLCLSVAAWSLWQAYAWIEVDQHGIVMSGWLRPRSLAWSDITGMWTRTYFGRSAYVTVLQVSTTNRRLRQRIPVPHASSSIAFPARNDSFSHIAADLHNRWWQATHTGPPPALPDRRGRLERAFTRRVRRHP
jgi:hypothetical protein